MKYHIYEKTDNIISYAESWAGECYNDYYLTQNKNQAMEIPLKLARFTIKQIKSSYFKSVSYHITKS